MQKIKSTESKNSQEESFTEYVKNIYDNSLDMIGSGNLEGFFTAINPAFERILGYSGEELLAKPFLDFVYEEDFEEIKNALMAAASGKETINIKNRYKCKDGSVKWIDWRVHCIVHDNQFIAVGRDITENKKVEIDLKESEKRFRILFNTMTVGVAIVDTNGNVLMANKADCDALGYSEEELIGMHFTEFTHPDDLQLDVELYTELIEE